jgi:hypothetical protein
VEIFNDHSTSEGIEVFTVRVDESEGGTGRASARSKLIGRGCNVSALACLQHKLHGPRPYWCKLASAAAWGLSGEGVLCLANSSSAPRRTASLVGLFILSQYGDRPAI